MMAKFKGKDVVILEEILHDPDDYVKVLDTKENATDRVKKQDIVYNHSEQLSKHVSPTVAKDTYHPKYSKQKGNK